MGYNPRKDEGSAVADPNINDVFKLLDEWRHLPDYQLERRADIYFALFLPKVLGKHCGTPINPLIIPEFPLKQPDSRLSDKVDYFALSENGKGAFFIELKTDMNSLKLGQAELLKEAATKGICELLSGVKSIASTRDDKQDRQKYFHLLQALENLKLIKMHPGLKDKMFSDRSQGVNEFIRNIDITCGDLKTEIIYIVPGNPKNEKQRKLLKEVKGVADCIIDFKELATAIKGHGELGKRFAESLEKWRENPAGSVQ